MNWYDDVIKKSPKYLSPTLVNDVDLLYPKFLLLILKTFVTARKEGLSVTLFETYRSQQRQVELFARGVTRLQTNGMHHFGIATDIVFLNGKNPSFAPNNNWARLGAIGRGFGLEWGGSWQGFVDLPHFQLVPATVADQAQIINKNYPPFFTPVPTATIVALYNQARLNAFLNPILDQLLGVVNTALNQSTVIPPLVPTPTPVPPPTILHFVRDLMEGPAGEDVRMLQKILNADPATQIALTGAGSPGQESNQFGPLTREAVQKFQIKYGIAAPGNPGFGLVGPKTRKKLEEVYASHL